MTGSRMPRPARAAAWVLMMMASFSIREYVISLVSVSLCVMARVKVSNESHHAAANS